ncbi:MAG: hypothetical protein WCI02_03690, partial [Planctomycetota bacterium]
LGENHQSPDQIPLNQQAGQRPAVARWHLTSQPLVKHRREIQVPANRRPALTLGALTIHVALAEASGLH